ncbi:acyltransferase [Bacteroidales bacterium OttesenSCG-928-J19]|nr:acyltransferase [Bacteroidales bacterium OttesenSCG-928-J19]
MHQCVGIKGIKNIQQNDGILSVGVEYYGFMHKTDKTFLNLKGKLTLNGSFQIGRGCRFNIGENGHVILGRNSFVNPNTTFIIMHKLVIGDNCSISWNCQFLDEDFHEINYSGKKESENSIIIGNNVWIGCNVKIYKGTVIPDNCVIASDSVVKGIFHEEYTLIAGTPGKVIKKEVRWGDVN